MAGIATGIHHVAVPSKNLETLADFYADVFGAAVVARFDYPSMRHWMIELGPGVVLHAFESPDITLDPAPGPMFQRGRLDHVAVQLPDRESFEVVRERLVARGASDGHVADFKSLLVLSFQDPDDRTLEICHVVPGMGLRHAEDPEPLREWPVGA